jgi:2'-hydroxyisoflavone reductase
MIWPGTPDDPVQIVDVRDLAYFTINCLDFSINGTYNMVNPAGSYTIGKLLQDSQAVTAEEVDAIWMDEAFLAENGLEGGRDLPVWHGAAEVPVSAERALAAGFDHRPERETARDLMSWWDTLPTERRARTKAGITAEKEAQVIAAWKTRNA